jgi:hypothetical protein
MSGTKIYINESWTLSWQNLTTGIQFIIENASVPPGRRMLIIGQAAGCEAGILAFSDEVN